MQGQFEAIFSIKDLWLAYSRQQYSIDGPIPGHCNKRQKECGNNWIAIGPSNDYQP
jgi:hypothetical protein